MTDRLPSGVLGTAEAAARERWGRADPRHLDDLDRAVAARLRADGRESHRALAQALGVHEATIASRLRRMETERKISVVALADFARLGFEFMAFALIETQSRAAHDVGADLAMIPEVISVVVTTGRYDLVCGLLLRDRQALSRLLGARVPAVPGVLAVACELIVDVDCFDFRWAALEAAPLPGAALRVPGDVVDALDAELIASLQRDARMSHRALASGLGVSAATVRQRLRRLEDDGLIQIRAVSDLAAFGLESAALVGVHAVEGRTDELAGILTAMSSIGAVMRSVGQFAILLVVVARNRQELLEVVLHQIQGIDLVARTETFEVAATLKHDHAWIRLLD